MADSQCITCGAGFEQNTGRGRRREYCYACAGKRRLSSAGNKGGEWRVSLRECAACKREFYPTAKPQKFCGVGCSQPYVAQVQKDRAPRYNCQHCGIEFKPKHYRYTKYCSRDCHFLAVQARPSPTTSRHWVHWFFRTCSECGARFIARSSDGCICSDLCRRKRRSDAQTRRDAAKATAKASSHPPRICGECGNSFVPVYGDKRREYCSIDCGNKRNGRIAKRKRRAIERGACADNIDPNAVFNRDGWRCHICGCRTPRRLRGSIELKAPEMDHIIPLSKGGSHTMDNVACCCRECNMRKGAKIIGQLRLSVSC